MKSRTMRLPADEIAGKRPAPPRTRRTNQKNETPENGFFRGQLRRLRSSHPLPGDLVVNLHYAAKSVLVDQKFAFSQSASMKMPLYTRQAIWNIQETQVIYPKRLTAEHAISIGQAPSGSLGPPHGVASRTAAPTGQTAKTRALQLNFPIGRRRFTEKAAAIRPTGQTAAPRSGPPVQCIT